MNCPQDSQIFGLITTNVSKCARGSGIVTRHRMTCDITPGGAGVASVTVSWLTCGHNQVPLSPPRPQVARQNILWEQGSLERGDLTVGVLIKLNFIGLQRREMMMIKEVLIKMKLSFCVCLNMRSSLTLAVKVRELNNEKIVSVFSLYICICLSVRDEK